MPTLRERVYTLPGAIYAYPEEESLHFAAVLAPLLVHHRVYDIFDPHSLVGNASVVVDEPDEDVWQRVLWLVGYVTEARLE